MGEKTLSLHRKSCVDYSKKEPEPAPWKGGEERSELWQLLASH